MNHHPRISETDEHSESELMDLAERLFSAATPAVELERICMRLAHADSENAHQLLERFRQSPRASAVEWLECAVEEGAFHLMSPRNELEEHEFLVLKVIEETEDAIIDLCMRRDELDLERRKLLVRRTALAALVEAGRFSRGAVAGIDAERAGIEAEMRDIDDQIVVEEAIVKELRASITTPRYQSADPNVIRSIHLL